MITVLACDRNQKETERIREDCSSSTAKSSTPQTRANAEAFALSYGMMFQYFLSKLSPPGSFRDPRYPRRRPERKSV